METQHKINKRFLALSMMIATAIVWGIGFVVSNQLVNASSTGANFAETPNFLNFIRFSIASICLIIIFAKQLKLTKQTLLYSGVGGLFLFGGFGFQLIGMANGATPASSGFFTAAYIVFVPIISLFLLKKRPSNTSFIAVAIALVGLTIFSLEGIIKGNDTIQGNLLTLVSAILFAFQIVWTDETLRKQKVDHVNMSVWQIVFATLFFGLATLLFETKRINISQIDLSYCSWRIAIVALGGTSFAYYAQTYAQNHLPPSETALIMVCESPIGAIISVAIGLDLLTWQLVVGGVLVMFSVVVVEVLPNLFDCKKRTTAETQPIDAPPQEDASTEAQ